VRGRLFGGGDGLDRACDFGPLNDDLVSDFASMDFDVAWEVESDSDAFTFDGSDANDPDWVPGITDNDFFAFATRDDEHERTPPCSAAQIRREAPPMYLYHTDHRGKSPMCETCRVCFDTEWTGREFLGGAGR